MKKMKLAKLYAILAFVALAACQDDAVTVDNTAATSGISINGNVSVVPAKGQ